MIFINQAASSFNRNVIATLSEIPLKGHGVLLEKGKKRREGCIKFILCPLIMFSEEKLKVCLTVLCNGGKYIRGSLTARGSNNSRHYS